MTRSYSAIRPKKNTIYTVDEVLTLYGITRNTLTNWIEGGLRTADCQRPQLFRGDELLRFHTDRALANRRKLRKAEFKCVRCKARVVPSISSLEISVPRDGASLASAQCPQCNGPVFRLLDASTCAAYQACLNTNTSLQSLHEKEGAPQAGIAINRPSPAARWNADNVRIIRAYQDFCGKYSIKTKDAHLASIRDFEVFVGLRSFRQVRTADAAAYRDELAKRGRESSSRSSIAHRSSHLASFFDWLVQQEGYRQMNHSIRDYFQLSRRDHAKAIQPAARRIPTFDELRTIVGAMPSKTLAQRRNRAIVALTCLFGARADATASLQLGDLDVERRSLRQDATRVRVKNSKSQITMCFPVGELFWRVLKDWISELRKFGMRNDDAMFPPDPELLAFRGFMRADRADIEPWATEAGVRRAFRLGCEAAKHDYINPHAVRHALAALGRELCRSVAEEQAWSHNLGHQSVQITRSHYARMTDAHRDEVFNTLGRRDPTPDEDKDLLIRFLLHETVPGTPEHERGKALALGRLGADKTPSFHRQTRSMA